MDSYVYRRIRRKDLLKIDIPSHILAVRRKRLDLTAFLDDENIESQDYFNIDCLFEFLKTDSLELLSQDIYYESKFDVDYELIFDTSNPVYSIDKKNKIISGIFQGYFSSEDDGWRALTLEYFIVKGIEDHYLKIESDIKTKIDNKEIDSLNVLCEQWLSLLKQSYKLLEEYNAEFIGHHIVELFKKLIKLTDGLPDGKQIRHGFLSEAVKFFKSKPTNIKDFEFKGRVSFLEELFDSLEYNGQRVFEQSQKETFLILMTNPFNIDTNRGKIEFQCTSQAAAYLISVLGSKKSGQKYFNKLSLISAGESGIFRTKPITKNGQTVSKIFIPHNFVTGFDRFEDSFNPATGKYSIPKKEEFKNQILSIIARYPLKS